MLYWLDSRVSSGDEFHNCSHDSSTSPDKVDSENKSDQPIIDMKWVWVHVSCNSEVAKNKNDKINILWQ